MALLNIADAIYLGDKPVDRVYVGAQRVWPGTQTVYLGPQVGTGTSMAISRRPVVTKLTLPTDGEIVEIVADRSAATAEFKLILYVDNGGVPGDLVYVSEALSGAFTSLPVSIPVTAGSYWLGVVSANNISAFTPLVHEPGNEYAQGGPSSWPSWSAPNPTEWVGSVNQPNDVSLVPYVGLWYVPAE